MKTLRNYFLTAVLLMTTYGSFAQARVQVIHNSADAAVSVVDVWLDQTLLLDNFAFRTASPFLDILAGVQFTIAVKGPDSQSPDNPLWSQTFTLTDGEKYILVAVGIISASGYDPPKPFSFELFPGAHEIANQFDMTDMLVHHGSTDAPTIDIYEVNLGMGLIVDNLSYAEFDGYLEIPSKDYIFEVRDESGNITIAAYYASFQELEFRGKAITMLASGFLIPGNNSGGPAFGLWVATADGGPLIELPAYNPTARVQVIHNSADEAASIVDVWLNETLLLDNFAFRTASPFIDVPAEEEITISVAGPDSQNPDDPFWTADFNLTVDQTYILVAEGIISPSGYDPATPFNIAVYPQGREIANLDNKTDMLVHHGSTDAPTVDIYETGIGLGILVDDLSYAEFAGYLELEPLDYIIEVRDETGTEIIAAYEAPLETMGLEGFAITVVASGFLTPENNSDGPAFGLWMASAAGGNLVELPPYAPSARVQVIHNSADAAAEVVDIWLNETLLLDNFAFQTASPFVDIPAEEVITIAVLGPNSQGPENPLWSQTYTLANEGKYILVAEGIISASGYDPVIPFTIAVYPQAREIANQGSQTDMLIHHGSTDAPAIDIIEVGIGVGPIVDNFAFGEFVGYLGLATVDYIFQVRDETGLTKIAAYRVPLGLMGLQGDAVTMLTSGFINPENNSEGPDFGLYMAQASGGPLIRMQEYAPKARLQVIHNSADTAADVIDIWLNQDLLLDNFAFRSASPFIDAPADEQFTLYIKGPDSQDPYNPMWFHNYSLTEGETYLLVADGILSPSGYDPIMLFDLSKYESAREEAAITGRTDVLIHHGSTDAPSVDVIEIGLGAGTLVNDLTYNEFSSYLELPTIDYILEVRDQGKALLGAFRAPLQSLGLEDEAITVVASGFIDPAVNSNGAAFGLWAALASGGPLVELPSYVPSAMVQVIHNSADAILSEVDIWLDDELLLDNFAFRSATPFTFIPANTEITLSVCTANSQDPSNPLWTQNYTLVEDENYILVADGIISPEGYDPLTPFTLHVYTGASLESAVPSNTDILIFHGSTDAPTIDIVEAAGTLVDDISYGEFDGYLDLPTADYTLSITDETGATVVAIFSVPLADLDLDGKTLTILASGFLDPSVNNEGPEFGLLAVEADGTAFMLTNTFGINETPPGFDNITVYPNPASDLVNITFDLKSNERISMEVLDMTGRIVRSASPGMMNPGVYHLKIDVEELPSGMYILNINTEKGKIDKKLFKQ
jgi:hypothetical protein